MTTVDRTGASDAEFEARIKPFEADERVETVARALWDALPAASTSWGGADPRSQQAWRRLAAAAIAALPPTPAACGDLSPSINFGGDSDAERLMCELPVNHGGAHQHDNGDGLPPTRWIATGPSPAEEAVKRVEALAGELAAIESADAGYSYAAGQIRAALASPAPAPQGEEGQR